MNYLDLFSGIGGFSLAFQNAGFKFDKHYYSEVDKYAQSIYQRQFPGAIRLGDVTKVSDGLGKIDIITGGFPCQSFSIAGKRGGFTDTRGTLFFEIERLARIYKPAYLLLENVKGLASHEGGDTIRVILDRLRRLDYSVQLLLLNTKDFGIPQNRERYFFICTAAGKPRPEISSIREHKAETAASNEMTTGQSQGYRVYNPEGNSCTLAGEAGGLGAKTGLYAIGEIRTDEGLRTFKDNVCGTLRAMESRGDKVIIVDREGKQKKREHASCLSGGAHSGGNHSDMDLLITPVLSPDRIEKRQNGRRFKEPGEPSFTLTAQNRHGVMMHRVRTNEGKKLRKEYEAGNIKHGFNEHRTLEPKEENISGSITTFPDDNILQQNLIIRRLTPIECERLQGFPDNWTQYGENGETISDSQKYKTLGNAVTVTVVQAIAAEIRKVIDTPPKP